MIILVLLSACAGNPTSGRPGSGRWERNDHPVHPYQLTENPSRNLVMRTASRQLGQPYRWGGETPGGGFDCSGLVFFAHQQAGLTVPRISKSQLHAAKKVPIHKIQPGDLVFFRLDAKMSHVGIYLGQNRFIHAPSSGKKVSLGSLNNRYWRKHLIAAGNFYR